jgi:hypothetical protein
VASFVRFCAVLASAVVALSLLLFTLDESGTGSENQVRSVANATRIATDTELGRPAPPADIEAAREASHSKAREYLDDGNDVLVAPFTTFFDSSSVWLERMVTAVLALLLYGLGGLMAANWLPAPESESHDWRTAP